LKANEAPEKLYLHPTAKGNVGASWLIFPLTNEDIEYVRTDAFIEKARKWFEMQPETYDANGVRVYGEEDFEDFVNYMEK